MDFFVGMEVTPKRSYNSKYYGQIGTIVKISNNGEDLKVIWPDNQQFSYGTYTMNPASQAFKNPIDCPSFDEILRQH